MPAAVNPPLTKECCIAAPPVLEFDADGNLVGHWGGPGEGYEWPSSNHGITVDAKGNVWIGGNGPNDSHVLKFTSAGKLVKQFGRQGARTKTSDGARAGNGQPAGQPAGQKETHARQRVWRDPACARPRPEG